MTEDLDAVIFEHYRNPNRVRLTHHMKALFGNEDFVKAILRESRIGTRLKIDEIPNDAIDEELKKIAIDCGFDLNTVISEYRKKIGMICLARYLADES